MTETPETLYHYCSTAAFQSIVEKRELWLTDLSLSNDNLEGKWAVRRYLDSFDLSRPEDRTAAIAARACLETKIINRCTCNPPNFNGVHP